jgi:hypothetical protein
VDVLLELADGFGREGVRHDFAFARVFGAVAGVEESAPDRDEGVVVFTGSLSETDSRHSIIDRVCVGKGENVPFQKTITVSVDGVDG